MDRRVLVFVSAGSHRPRTVGPCDFEPCDVTGVDLREWGIASTVGLASVVDPAIRRIRGISHHLRRIDCGGDRLRGFDHAVRLEHTETGGDDHQAEPDRQRPGPSRAGRQAALEVEDAGKKQDDTGDQVVRATPMVRSWPKPRDR